MNSLNIFFIVINSLRKDYAKPLEDKLKQLGFKSYENAIAPAPWTVPSHASMLTGLYPSIHGAHENKNRKVLDVKIKKSIRRILLSEQLLKRGYETYLITANGFISPYFGFTGFKCIYNTLCDIIDLLNNEIEIFKIIKSKYNPQTKIQYVKALIRSRYCGLFLKFVFRYLRKEIYKFVSNYPLDKGADNAIKKLKEIIKTTSKHPKFVFINLLEPHEPYSKMDKSLEKIIINALKTNRVDSKLVQKWRKGYIKEVEYVTNKILDFIKLLKNNGVFDNSLIIVTSDHGQLLGEHGRISHGVFLYDELLRVPLLIKYPKDINIEFVEDKSKWISLTKLKFLILYLIENELADDRILYSDSVFAESHGIQYSINDEPLSEEEKRNIEQLEKYRIAVYYKNFKGIFNVNDWIFEEVSPYSSNEIVTKDIIRKMKKEIIKLLKTVTLTKTLKIK